MKRLFKGLVFFSLVTILNLMAGKTHALTELVIGEFYERRGFFVLPILPYELQAEVDKSALIKCTSTNRMNIKTTALQEVQTFNYAADYKMYTAVYLCNFDHLPPPIECYQHSDCPEGFRCQIFFGDGPFQCVPKPASVSPKSTYACYGDNQCPVGYKCRVNFSGSSCVLDSPYPTPTPPVCD